MYCVRSLISFARVTNQFKRNTLFINNKIGPVNFFSQLNEVNDTDAVVTEICKGDSELEKKLKILMLEVEVMRQDGRKAPTVLVADEWQHLLKTQSKNQRVRYLSFLFKKEMMKNNRKIKKEAKRLDFQVPEENKEYPDDVLYGLRYQSLFLRIQENSMNRYDNYRCLVAAPFSQPLVIDCSYEDNMVSYENANAAKQMTLCYGENRIHKNPFNIYMCNVNGNGEFMKKLHKHIPILDEPWFPMSVQSKSYLDLFPKEKLVYLTPNCHNDMTQYDHNAIYIIGCLVDKVNQEPLSMAKAKREGIRMAKLPLERYLDWGSGSKKTLTVNQMMSILLDMKETGDWEYSLRHVPRRKLMSEQIMAIEKRYNKENKSMKTKNIFKDPTFARYTKKKQNKFHKYLQDSNDNKVSFR